MSEEQLKSLINSCHELVLPNGADGAIWKDDLLEKISKFFNPSIEEE